MFPSVSAESAAPAESACHLEEEKDPAVWAVSGDSAPVGSARIH